MVDIEKSALSIDINLNKCAVHLSGYVDSEFERQRAEKIARSLDGVLSPRNDLIAEK